MKKKKKTQPKPKRAAPAASKTAAQAAPAAAAPPRANLFPALGALLVQVFAALDKMNGFTSLSTRARMRIVKLRKGAASVVANMITLAEDFPDHMPRSIDTVTMRAQLAQLNQLQLLTHRLDAAHRQAQDELLAQGESLWKQSMLIYGVGKLMVKTNAAIATQLEAMTTYLARGKYAKKEKGGAAGPGSLGD